MVYGPIFTVHLVLEVANIVRSCVVSNIGAVQGPRHGHLFYSYSGRSGWMGVYGPYAALGCIAVYGIWCPTFVDHG